MTSAQFTRLSGINRTEASFFPSPSHKLYLRYLGHIPYAVSVLLSAAFLAMSMLLALAADVPVSAGA